MADTDTGGPAFPPHHDPDTHPSGMTLLDYYAGKAMELAMQKMRDNYTANLGEDWNWDAGDFEGVAINSFDMAEAMIAERKKRYG